jgi:hypothetical protein
LLDRRKAPIAVSSGVTAAKRAKEIWEELGFPESSRACPGTVYSLGAWTAEDEEEAEIALRGDDFLTGEKAKNHRVKP